MATMMRMPMTRRIGFLSRMWCLAKSDEPPWGGCAELLRLGSLTWGPHSAGWREGSAIGAAASDAVIVM